ncbi:MAG: 30S ribosomal protein S27ae [Aigarchaeota archaeon]|nr:30S ribosomal protein S27ae [Candidatus Calditenuaceae archaeon]
MPKKERGLWRLYSLTPDGKFVRRVAFCPICGPGYIMARHQDRYNCGRCGYTSFTTEQRPQ